MTGTGGVRPRGAADRSGGPEGEQAAAAAGGADRAALALGAAALAGWALLAAAGGGIDPGDGLGGAGPAAAFLGLALGAPLAVACALRAWETPALRSGPARLALGAMAGIALWSGLSIAWAAAPDLAWIDANRQALGLCALTAGVALGALLPEAPRLLGLGLTLAAAPPVALALGSRIAPEALGSDGELGRLSHPVGYWNGLALVAAMAAPGLLWLAGGERARRWTLPLAAAGLSVVIVTVLLTYSRGGLLALAMACAVTTAFLPRRGDALAALTAGVAGAAWPAAYALRDPLLSADGIAAEARAPAGAGLGWRLALGLVIAAAAGPFLARLAARLGADRRRLRRAAAGAAAGACLIAAVAAAASPGARDWAGDRVREFRGEGGDAVANDPGRIVSAAGNQRAGWWGEAWRGFADAPVAGHGAGGFRLVHLRERRVADDALNTNEPHQVLLRFLSGTGLVGAALFAALVAALLWATVRTVERGRAGPALGMPLAVMAAFALQAAVDWSWAIPALTVPALGAGGVVLAAAAGAAPASARRPRPAVAALLAALAVAAAASAAMPWWSAAEVRAGREDLAAGRVAEAAERAEAARGRNPLALAPLRLLGDAAADAGDLGRALGAYEEMTRVQPDNPASWRALAALAELLGDRGRAASAWREVVRLDPLDPRARAGAASSDAPAPDG